MLLATIKENLKRSPRVFPGLVIVHSDEPPMDDKDSVVRKKEELLTSNALLANDDEKMPTIFFAPEIFRAHRCATKHEVGIPSTQTVEIVKKRPK